MKQIEVKLDLLVSHAGRHENAAQHQVFQGQTNRATSGDVTPGLGRCQLGFVRQFHLVHHAQGPQSARTPVRFGLYRVVHSRVDVFSHQLHRHITTAFERDVNHFFTHRLLQQHGDDLVFLLGAGAAHFESLVGLGLHGGDEIFGRLVRRIGMDPQHKLVKRQHRDWRQVPPVERHASSKRRGEQVGQGDDDFVRISSVAFDVQKALGSSAAGLVQHNDRLRTELVLGNHALHKAGHLVRTTAGSSGHHKLNGLARLPGLSRAQGTERAQKYQAQKRLARGKKIHGHSLY